MARASKLTLAARIQEEKWRQDYVKKGAELLADLEGLKLRNERAEFMRKYMVIRDESGSFIPFEMNNVQKHYYQSRTVRDIILKPRKVGFTTLWMVDQFVQAATTQGYQVLAFTYDDEEAEYMFSIVRRCYEHLPEGFAPSLGKDTGTAMSFPRLDSFIEIQSAGGRRKGRGRTPSAILLDEFGQYDENAAVEIFASVVNSAPPWTPITIQSTPKGIGNEFHRLFVRALNSESPFKAHFYPWMWLPQKHRLEIDSPLSLDKDKQQLELDTEELTLLSAWNEAHNDLPLNESNIRWRRYKKAEQGELMTQEFPEDSVSCFLATSETVFDTKTLIHWLQTVRQPQKTDFNSALNIYKRPQPSIGYCIGVDCGEGILGRDNSVALIGTTGGEVVAVFAGIFDQIEMAQRVYELGTEYNNAFVLNERQGAFTFQLTLHNMGYKNLYKHQEFTTGRSRATPVLGFPTTQMSKRQLIDGMRNALKGDAFRCADIETLRELVEFKRHKDGTYGAPQGGHDDRAMAAMLYLQAVEASERTTGRTRHILSGGSSKVSSYPQGAFA